MIQFDWLLLEEPALEGRQRRFTADEALFDGNRFTLAYNSRKFRNRLVLEDLLGC